MDILNVLKRLRDDMRAWVTNNLNALDAKIDNLTGAEAVDKLEIHQMINTIVQEKIDNGELGGSGAISATDDGNGNVTLTVVGFSVLDDGNGNIVIS